ncbi:MAG: hypothetical protein ACI4R6_00215 [Lachnospiraceae bacterium]
MSVNGITQNNYDTKVYNTSQTAKKTGKTDSTSKSSSASFSDDAAVYEASNTTAKQKSNAAIVAQMKKDLSDRTSQLKSLVADMFLKQGQTFASSEDMLKALANGELKVDSATAAQAREDISEDGYWGVKQTSDRIFDFAMALSGGDEDKMQDMLAAFKKGYEQATGAWGRELPSLCKDTYDAVEKKFDDYFNKDE